MDLGNEQLFTGLLTRLLSNGLTATVATELASANYPTSVNMPLRAVRCKTDAVHWHTENYLDNGTSSLEDTWLSIWGVTPLAYFGLAPDSVEANELGLTSLDVAHKAASESDQLDGSTNPQNWNQPENSEDPLPDGVSEYAEGLWTKLNFDAFAQLSGSGLPASASPRTKFFADLVCGVSYGMPGSLDEGLRKGYKRLGFYPRPPEGWVDDLAVISFFYAVNMLTSSTSCNLLVEGETREHLIKIGNQVHSALPEMLATDLDTAAVSMKAARAISDVAQKRGVSLSKDTLQIGIQVAASFAGGLAYMKRVSSIERFALPFIKALEVLADGNPEDGVRPDTTPFASISEPVGRDYQGWKEFCLRLADRRAIPRHFAEALIPPQNDLDWTIKPTDDFEQALSDSNPLRREWLASHGVTSADFERFWSRPSWIQNFIEALVTRNVELEFEARLGLGEDENLAFASIGLFVPIYRMSPDPEGSDLFLPWELFDRVEEYWAQLSTEEIERLMIDNGYRSVADHVRARVADGQI